MSINPWLHPFKWNRAIKAHKILCHAHGYLCDQPQPHNAEAINLLYRKTWELFEQI